MIGWHENMYFEVFSTYIKKLDLQVLKNQARVPDPVPVQQVFLYGYYLGLKTGKSGGKLAETIRFVPCSGTCRWKNFI